MIIRTHEKKLRNLTKCSVLPFTHDEIITNLSSTKLTYEELDLLKYGLKHAIPPAFVNKTDVFTTFELIHRTMTKDLKAEKNSSELKAQISYIANSYVNSYKPSQATLRKHGILKKLRNNKNIVIVVAGFYYIKTTV